MNRSIMLASEIEPAPTRLVVEPQRVDHRDETALHATLDHQREDVESVGSGPLIVLAGANQAPQLVSGDDLVGPEVGCGPRRLPRAGCPHQDDERAIGNSQHRVGVHSASFARPSG